MVLENWCSGAWDVSSAEAAAGIDLEAVCCGSANARYVDRLCTKDSHCDAGARAICRSRRA